MMKIKPMSTLFISAFNNDLFSLFMSPDKFVLSKVCESVGEPQSYITGFNHCQ